VKTTVQELQQHNEQPKIYQLSNKKRKPLERKTQIMGRLSHSQPVESCSRGVHLLWFGGWKEE